MKSDREMDGEIVKGIRRENLLCIEKEMVNRRKRKHLRVENNKRNYETV